MPPQGIAPKAHDAGDLSHGLSHSAPNPALQTDSRSLADALLAKAQEATDPATVRALVDAARALLAKL